MTRQFCDKDRKKIQQTPLTLGFTTKFGLKPPE
uniref:Uncharacterized protein n=1 Tax=Anguilla anguilla TaxID=7936 RepID=A0A0E9U9H3_ANGAN